MIKNVLSLFDGMSCGQIALNRCGIRYENYYASEIDNNAIRVAMKNYPDTIQVGNVIDLKTDILPQIDLLIGGSPCQGFSIAGKKLNFEDPRSKLFFEFVRILNECNPKYFLLENVRMKKEYEQIITDHLGVSPIRINSSLVSAQMRDRLYWTNIPNLTLPEDKKLSCKDIIDHTNTTINKENWQNWWKINHEFQLKKRYSVILNDVDKAITMTARQVSNWNGNLIRSENGLRFLTPLEAERLQTLPENYTDCVSNAQRYKMIGNGWTVDVISHILKNII